MKDNYVHDMDWGVNDKSKFSNLANYRSYQYQLISKYIGKSILEIGTGDGGFTEQIARKNTNITKLLSIEPSRTLFDNHLNKISYPKSFQFACSDLFDLSNEYYNIFDTVIFVHVLEHIENDKKALDFVHPLLTPGGRVLIEVPALEWLYSDHDRSIGHFRRYNKSKLLNTIDQKKYLIEKIWYQDPIGVAGSLFYFKFKKIKLKSDEGEKLFKVQGKLYDDYIIPFEQKIEKYVTFPFGLSLTAVLQKI